MSYTIQDCIDRGDHLFTQAELCYGHGTDNAADEALWLVFYQLGLSWDTDPSVLQQILQQEVSADDVEKIIQLFQRRVQERIPAAYLSGEAWFAAYPFYVNPQVLVPRSPIAELIQQQFAPWLRTSNPAILDLCTGSGCIGIASALYLPEAQVVLSDISAAAINVAQENIHRHNVSDQVCAVESDLFEQLSGQTFDLIVTNPPYVDAKDFKDMPPEFHAEPKLGLVSGEDGLDFTRRLLREAAAHLNSEGILIAEVGNSWVNLQAAFPQVPFLWLEFEHGGHGVFVMTKQELAEYQNLWL